MSSTKTIPLITPDSMLPDVLRAFPQVRSIFDRYGLRGCGGSLGPAESVAYFARAHGVDIDQLLSELNRGAAGSFRVTANSSEPSAGSTMDELADGIYRRFFKAGLVVIMTAGAVWGAILLLRIGAEGSFTALSIHEINAHGHAQIFGWVGLFVMGFAYQAFPRIHHTTLWRPDLANMTFYLMVLGILARAVGEPLHYLPVFREMALAAGFAEIAAIGLFGAIILNTIGKSGKRIETYTGFVIASMVFFLVQAVYDLGLLYGTTAPHVANHRLLHLVSVYQGPLRDIQIHGFAMLMILGVGLRMFPALFGLSSPKPLTAKISLILLIAAVVGEAISFILMRRLGGSIATGSLFAFMLLLAIVSVTLTFRWGILANPCESDRSIKFIRAATAWLHVSMLMLVLAPLYMYAILPNAGILSVSGQRSVDIGFSHAYGGAIRHAITVGFISLTILGMAAKVVPTLSGLDIRKLRGLWIPFALVNIGCFLRVFFQVATDFAEWAYPIVGMSGLLEVAGIGVWGVHLWRIMAGSHPAHNESVSRPGQITADDKVGMIVDWYPETLPILLARGFRPLRNSVLRRTLARSVSLRTAARQHDIDESCLLDELNGTIARNRAQRVGSIGRSASLDANDREGLITLPVLQQSQASLLSR